MYRRHVFGLAAAAVLGAIVVPGSAHSQTLKQQLGGTWTLTGWEQDVANGPKFHRFGANPKGYHIFDANGRFYAMFARSDLPKIASNNPSNPTPDEAKAIVGGSIAYYGTYTIDEAAKIVTLTIESSSFANQVGAAQKRTVTSISTTELKMQNTTALSGGQIYYTFKKAN